ncbi:DUF4411 family protein [Halochromatium glycolicum]|uniref:DUF4411 family protein n=1 Tax=Halochromatium glycolicum TaxID=85075 RepID=A0AAJ0U3H0_9GAMM|nr:DUF4411 family protein [Halochromatium glycolicum]MBK1704521.1 hypothetical protein [Halochromatium glycolicum]
MTVGATKAFVLDANVFIEAHRRYYGFDLCPGFWACLDHHHAGARLLSIDRVRGELQGGDALAQWVKHTAPDSLFQQASVSVLRACMGRGAPRARRQMV